MWSSCMMAKIPDLNFSAKKKLCKMRESFEIRRHEIAVKNLRYRAIRKKRNSVTSANDTSHFPPRLKKTKSL